MALHEESVMDREFGDYLNHDLAAVPRRRRAPTSSDIEATWIEEDDPHLNPMGAKGIGEIGIVGTAAAMANAGPPRDRRARPRPADPPRPRAGRAVRRPSAAR